MAKELLMPKAGNTVESCVILEFRKKEGDTVKAGDIVCEVETDKATFEVPAEDEGTLLKIFYKVGDDVPVLTPIAVIGKPGEDISGFRPASESGESASEKQTQTVSAHAAQAVQSSPEARQTADAGFTGVSPRARKLAESKGVDFSVLAGTGPGGRVIERDVQSAVAGMPSFSPAALEARAKGSAFPSSGSGIGGRILAADMGSPESISGGAAAGLVFPGGMNEIPVRSVRKITAERMHQSLSTTAQFTLNSSADATSIMNYRKKCKASQAGQGLSDITINDMVLFAVSRVLPKYRELNSHFLKDRIVQFDNVHLGFAVDTPRGLMVPVIRFADSLSLRQISEEAKRLGIACAEGKVSPDELAGSTFTVSNLGSLGVESFTPVVNIPEAAILGVNAITLKPVQKADGVAFVQHIGFSLTIDHQAVDGAPAARFLKDICSAVAEFELTLAF